MTPDRNVGFGISFHSEYFISLQSWGWSGLRKPPPRLQARCQPGSVHQLGVGGRWELFHPMAAPSSRYSTPLSSQPKGKLSPVRTFWAHSPPSVGHHPTCSEQPV